MADNSIIAKNIRKQLAMNAGQLTLSNNSGGYNFVNSAGQTISPGSANASNYMLSNVPATYQSGIRADVYNYARSVFSGQNVPAELVESLASLATYYASQTGVSVQSLFKDKKLDSAFQATVNSFLNSSLQFGYQTLKTDQPWANNPTLHGNIAAALQPSLK